MLPALVDFDTFAARVPGGVSDDDQSRAQAAIDDASTLVRAETNQSWTTDGELDLPSGTDAWKADILQKVCIAAALRGFLNPDNLTAETVDGYSSQWQNASPDVYLNAAERRMLQKVTGRSGLFTIPTTRSDIPDTIPSGLEIFVGDAYVDVEDGELLPFLPVDAGNGL